MSRALRLTDNTPQDSDGLVTDTRNPAHPGSGVDDFIQYRPQDIHLARGVELLGVLGTRWDGSASRFVRRRNRDEALTDETAVVAAA